MIAHPPPPAAHVPPSGCRPSTLRLTLDGRDGEFDGLSHSGVLLVLENGGRSACTLPGLPRVEALDARGDVLPIMRRTPPGMHPGPVIVPVRVPPGGAVSALLRWVSGQVVDGGRCFTPVELRVSAGEAVLRARWRGGEVCGEAPPARRASTSRRCGQGWRRARRSSLRTTSAASR